MANTLLQTRDVSALTGRDRVARPSAAPLSAANKVGFSLVLAFTFLVFARIPEFLANFAPIPLAMITSGLAAIAALMAMDLRRLSRMPAVLFLLAFSVWLGIAGVFSTWHGGTFQMFKDYWSKSITICIVVSMLVLSLEHIRRFLYTLAYATVALVAIGIVLSGSSNGRMVIGTEGSLSNPNEIASRLMVGFCFCIFVLESERGFNLKRVVVGLTIPALLYMTLRTGSRSGLLTLAVVLLLLFLRVGFFQKLIFIVCGVVVFSGAFLTLPRDVIDRYMFMFTSAQDVQGANLTDDEKIAIGSRDARVHLAEEAFGLSLSHPIFGVGPGVYESAAAEQAKAEGRRAMWHETHNTFLQVSAEDGLPALALFLLALGYCLVRTYSLYKRAKRDPQLVQLSRMAYCLTLALVSWSIGAAFDSEAYRLEFPMMAAIVCGLLLAAEPLLKGRLKTAPASVSSQPVAFPVPVAAVPAPASPLGNPYRFGRRRNR